MYANLYTNFDDKLEVIQNIKMYVIYSPTKYSKTVWDSNVYATKEIK